jgi:aerobic-type carbon monoxide dehydrogenase small subunit (CoxS/CutS family)
MKKTITFTLNGTQINVTADSHQTLLDVLRDTLCLTGTKEGCGAGECGACTVLIDDLAINACLYPAFETSGKSVTTIEGIAGEKNSLSIIQQAFVDSGAIQCGFCTPGIILSAKALLDTHPDPSEAEIREALSGNLCRCTGYVQIIEAVKKTAARMKEKP